MMNFKGYTLIELILSIAIFVVISIPIFNFVTYCFKSSEQIAVKNYLLESARITLDFLTTEIKMADELNFLVIESDIGGINNQKKISSRDYSIDPSQFYTLYKAKFRGIRDNNTAMILYNTEKSYLSSKYHRVDFGGSNKDNFDDNNEVDNVEIIDDVESKYYVREFSRYISDIKIAFDFKSDLIYIKVISDDRIDYTKGSMSTPFVFEGTVSLKNKIIKEIN